MISLVTIAKTHHRLFKSSKIGAYYSTIHHIKLVFLKTEKNQRERQPCREIAAAGTNVYTV